MEELLHDPAARDRIGANARKLAVDRYAWSMIAAAAAHAVRNLLKGAPIHAS
jgi:glycosyltransferase involved in cell wall biosynthesis